MTLDSYSVARYRCFVDTTQVDLRPLTLIFGRNAAGKSALIRALPLLADSVTSQDAQPLALSSKTLRGASYREVASKYTERNALVFTLSWQERSSRLNELHLQFRDMAEQNRHVLEELRARVDDDVLRLQYSPKSATEHDDTYDVSWKGRTGQASVSFAGLMPEISRVMPKWLRPGLTAVNEQLLDFGNSVNWLTAVRAPIPRRCAPQRPRRLGPAGESVVDFLAADWSAERELVSLVSSSYESMFRHRLRIDESSDGVSVSLVPSDESPVSVPLADTGEGATQALAVFVLCALAKLGKLGESPIVVLEQPEMHLHPAAEKELGSFLANCTARHGVRFLIETHSENLLLYIQLAIAQGNLDSKKVAVYYARESEDRKGSSLDRIEISENGRPRNWPPGVFSEDVELARALLLAQRRRPS